MASTDNVQDQITAVILAGGRSSRMGCDKTLLRLGSHSMVAHQVQLVAPYVSQAIVAVDTADKLGDDLSHLLLPWRIAVDDYQSFEGPLAGILAAARIASTDWLLVRAADMPWLEPALMYELLAHISDDVDAVVPCGVNNYPEPLCALYRRTHVCQQQKQFDQGKRRVSVLFTSGCSLFLTEEQTRSFDSQFISFQNINYPDQLMKAQQSFALQDA